MSQINQHRGRPLADRQDLALEQLWVNTMPALMEEFDLREDQLAELLYDLGCWYADVEVGHQAAGPGRRLGRKGGAA